MLKVSGIDHIVLNVADGLRAMTWYRDRLGLQPVRFDEWERGDAPFLSLRVSETSIIDLLVTERTGENMNHFALWVEASDAEIDELLAHDDVELVRAFDSLYGAQGYGPAVYITDPDGNQVELKRY
ncbi:MAG: VOC family protein [Acidimicrobiales bacterium]|jgi:catechol 2,3-dioxygenase-like lactoylglutathione lyase family enzyme